MRKLLLLTLTGQTGKDSLQTPNQKTWRLQADIFKFDYFSYRKRSGSSTLNASASLRNSSG